MNHLFLARIATAPFSKEDYRVFGENHFPLVCVFTSYLERLLIRAPSSEAPEPDERSRSDGARTSDRQAAGPTDELRGAKRKSGRNVPSARSERTWAIL